MRTTPDPTSGKGRADTGGQVPPPGGSAVTPHSDARPTGAVRLAVTDTLGRSAAFEELRLCGAVHVWRWDLDGALAPDPADLDVLDDSERDRVWAVPTGQGAVLARTLAGARRALSEILDVPPAGLVLGRRPCRTCGAGDHGPPALLAPALPVGFSLARTEGRGVFAVSAAPRIGVDVEAVRPVDAVGLAPVVLTASERRHVLSLPEGLARSERHLRCWTRKEAVVKAAGTGLLPAPLTRIETRPDLPGPVTVDLRQGTHTSRWTVRDIPLDGPWTAALAHPVTGSGALALVLH